MFLIVQPSLRIIAVKNSLYEVQWQMGETVEGEHWRVCRILIGMWKKKERTLGDGKAWAKAWEYRRAWRVWETLGNSENSWLAHTELSFCMWRNMWLKGWLGLLSQGPHCIYLVHMCCHPSGLLLKWANLINQTPELSVSKILFHHRTSFPWGTPNKSIKYVWETLPVILTLLLEIRAY